MSESIEDYFGRSFDGIPVEYVKKKTLEQEGAIMFALRKKKATTPDYKTEIHISRSIS